MGWTASLGSAGLPWGKPVEISKEVNELPGRR